MDLKALAEAAFFLSTKPLSLEKVAELAGTGSLEEVKEAVERLQQDYLERDGGLEIVEMGENAFRIKVRSKYLEQVGGLTSTLDLSTAELRTLAFIAYKQPIKQSDVVRVRGGSVYRHIKKLRKLGFIRAKKERNTLILKQGPSFKQYFGNDAVSIKRKFQEQGAEVEDEGQEQLVQEHAAD
ncbi:MAG: SMC-Scp complex subunit ScpB [Candidatus Diapherotrites archaeon]|nr:SMC-Scp complex subunit ScpB [Candidatus Diapherotrites archaeon]